MRQLELKTSGFIFHMRESMNYRIFTEARAELIRAVRLTDGLENTSLDVASTQLDVLIKAASRFMHLMVKKIEVIETGAFITGKHEIQDILDENLEPEDGDKVEAYCLKVFDEVSNRVQAASTNKKK